ARRDEECAVFDHHLYGLVARERPVLDAVDPGTDAGPDARVAVRVRGDFQARSMCFVGDRRELFVRVLLRAGETAVRHHPTRGRDLDETCAVLDLVADGLAYLADTVRDALLDAERHDVG